MVIIILLFNTRESHFHRYIVPIASRGIIFFTQYHHSRKKRAVHAKKGYTPFLDKTFVGEINESLNLNFKMKYGILRSIQDN